MDVGADRGGRPRAPGVALSPERRRSGSCVTRRASVGTSGERGPLRTWAVPGRGGNRGSGDTAC